MKCYIADKCKNKGKKCKSCHSSNMFVKGQSKDKPFIQINVVKKVKSQQSEKRCL